MDKYTINVNQFDRLWKTDDGQCKTTFCKIFSFVERTIRRLSPLDPKFFLIATETIDHMKKTARAGVVINFDADFGEGMGPRRFLVLCAAEENDPLLADAQAAKMALNWAKAFRINAQKALGVDVNPEDLDWLQRITPSELGVTSSRPIKED